MLPVTMLLSVALVVVVQGVDMEIPECSNSNTRRQRHELECPPKAVCGDEWRTIKDWHNGTRCRDVRVVINCVCPDNTLCPVHNPNHLFYENEKHLQYLCEPRCDLGMCSTRLRAATEMIQNSPDFRRNNYYKINCRCPGHNEPMETRPGVLLRTTVYSRMFFNRTTGATSTWYRCAGDDPLTGDDTVCGGSPLSRARRGNFGGEDSWA